MPEPQHFGPEPHFTAGPEAVHSMIHDAAVGKTIARVYLGDSDPFPSLQPENSPPDGTFRSEYLMLEFTDASTLLLEIGAGNSFNIGLSKTADKIIQRTKSENKDKYGA